MASLVAGLFLGSGDVRCAGYGAPNVLVVASSRLNHTMKPVLAIAEGVSGGGAVTRVLAVANASFERQFRTRRARLGGRCGAGLADAFR